ncbi:MAG: hypothetical protein BGP16_04140 [Sphingobium sp. 66-54]|nr:MAG: hypothetical protein BGP16_04140 [Sphingobium sp. 66-54]
MTDLNAKLDRMLGKVDAIMILQTEHSQRLDDLSRRVALVEQGVTATKDVVEAWSAAKYSLRLVQRIAGFAAAIAGLVAAAKGWLHR